MAVDTFIKINGIKGESQDKAHKGEIDVLSWSFGASNSGSFHAGSGGGTGKSTVRDLTFEKYVDASSTELLKHVLTGKHIDEIKLVARKAGDSPLEYLNVTLKKVLVTSIDVGGSAGVDRVKEIIALNFAEIKFEYDSQSEKGGKGDHFAVGYNVAENNIV